MQSIWSTLNKVIRYNPYMMKCSPSSPLFLLSTHTRLIFTIQIHFLISKLKDTMSQTKQNTYATNAVGFWGWKGEMQNEFFFQECFVKHSETLFSEGTIEIKWSGTISYEKIDDCVLKAGDLNLSLEWRKRIIF